MTKMLKAEGDTIIIEQVFKKIEIPEARRSVAALREQSGLEPIALEMARNWQEAATDFGEHGQAFGFIQEQVLAHQHVFMEERDKSQSERNEERKLNALEKMEEAALKAEEYRKEHGLSELELDSMRSLARVDAMKGDYESAYQKCFRALGLVKDISDPQKRLRRFEIMGFLAEAIIGKGMAKEGVQMAKKVWEIYESEPELLELKKSDYFTWVVWRSGIRIMEVRVLWEKYLHPPYSNLLKDWLNQAERILKIPKGEPTWGDYKFGIRRREITALREKISSL